MDGLCGNWSELRASVETPADISANWTKGSGFGVSGRTKLFLEILMVFMCLGAVTGNILVIVIVAVTKTLHSVASVLIMNLAISDLLVGIGVMPFVAVSIMNHAWVNKTDLCLYVGFTSSVYCTASVLTLTAIALDRYHSIMDCLRYSSRCTLRICAVVLWIWLQALATSCPPLLGWSSVGYVAPMFSCVVKWASSPSYTALIAALSYLMPAVVILFCYLSIIKVAHNHARRIHTLEDSVQRSRNPDSVFTPGDSCYQQCGSLHSPSRLSIIYVESLCPKSVKKKEILLTLHSMVQQQLPQQNSQQHQSHWVVRLFPVMMAFFFAGTPYISVALVQAAETAVSGHSTLVPPSVVTLSYWLMLLNSDINPLLYSLLSKRFRVALQGLKQRAQAQLRSFACRRGKATAEDSTLSTAHPSPDSSSDSLTSDSSKCSSSIFTASTDFRHQSEGHPGNNTYVWQDAGVDCLQVPSQPQERSRLPFSALTKDQQATFFYGQITVRVEHIS
ncbi:LOW QUALITY PROTEIN: 5-hydroxytryptamine receptor 1D [Pholidichthys leucotaenia]